MAFHLVFAVRCPQAPLFEVRHQCSDRLIGLARVDRVVADAVVVAVPGVLDVRVAGVQMDEPHAAPKNLKKLGNVTFCCRPQCSC